jgi:hypothetical protein
MKVVLAISTALLALGTASGLPTGNMESTTEKYSSDSQSVSFYASTYHGCGTEYISVSAETNLVRNDGKKEPSNRAYIYVSKRWCDGRYSWRNGYIVSGLVMSGNARRGVELTLEGELSGMDCLRYRDCRSVISEPFTLHAILTPTGEPTTGHTINNEVNPITGYQFHSQYKSVSCSADLDLSGSKLPLLSSYEFENESASINDVKSGSITIIKPSDTEQGTRKALRSL